MAKVEKVVVVSDSSGALVTIGFEQEWIERGRVIQTIRKYREEYDVVFVRLNSDPRPLVLRAVNRCAHWGRHNATPCGACGAVVRDGKPVSW